MTKIIRSGKPESLGDLDTIQGDFRTQIDALTDAVRQLAGDPEIAPGTATVNDPLNAPYVLYVDANIGSDTFVTGDYAAADDGTYETKMKRISLQRLQCGYTVARPFRTISRAVIEAGIITSRDYLNLVPAPCGDLVTIIVGSGVHTALNGDGGTVSGAWTDGYEPTDAELTEFNPSNGGIVLPRGCSLVSLDLRKTIVRPDFVPEPVDEGDPLLTRRAIFKLTGGNYAYGFTFMDKPGFNKSHHLLDGFQFAGKTQLDEFYANIRAAFSGVANIDDTYAVTRASEYRIVGPQPATPVEAVDTTKGSSPYIYNCSLRSEWGMCGMWASGDIAVGFRSMVVAQYTGVSLQRDLNSWQRYTGGAWTTFTDYNQFIAENPNDVRFNPARRSYHVRTTSNAVIQEVSVFAIGQAIHHLAESGSQITITNSNSNFGGCAAIATGFLDVAAPEDTPWEVEKVRRALSPFDKTGNIKKIFLGTIEAGVANNATTLKLTADFDPEVLTSQEYSLEGNNYLWVDNPGGPDYRSLLTANPWEASAADEIDIQSAVTTDDADGNQVPDGGNELPNIAGLRIYVRRLRDVRSVEERRYSIILSMGGNERLPIRDYVIQPETGADWVDRIQAIAQVEATDKVTNGANIELRYSARPDSETAFSATTYYRPADTVRRDNKHWTARVDNYGAWDPKQWDESYVHMNADEYCPEGFFTNAQPIIVFNEDKSQAEDSTTLGNSLSSGIEKAQLVSGVDYVATNQFLRNLGKDAAAVDTMLTPQLKDDRDLDVSSEFWVVEFRRPTTIRLFGHAFEWAGYTNYSKALPQYQGDLSQSNQFTYYFTNEDGGKVYGSGFNQDGLLVTPRGLQDVTTGETLDLEDISNPDRPIDIPEVEFVWSRAGTTLLPTNLGDDVTIVSPGGAVNIALNNDGSAEYVAKVQSASTVKADPGKTLVTKDYLEDGGKGAEGDLGFWTREGTDLYPVNGSTDSVKIGGTLPGAPNINLNSSGDITALGTIQGGQTTAGSYGVIGYASSAALNTGAIYARNSASSGRNFIGIRSNTSETTSEILENGNARFVGSVGVGAFNDSATGTPSSAGTNLYSNGQLFSQRPTTVPGTDEAFKILYGTDPTFDVLNNGTTRIGGVIPAAPNISLNADGTAGFNGATPSDGRAIEVKSRTQAGIRIWNDASTGSDGAYINFWDTSEDVNTGQVKIGANENAITFQNQLDGAGNPAREIARFTDTGNFLMGGSLIPTNPNIALNADGTADFLGMVQTGDEGEGSGSAATGTGGVALTNYGAIDAWWPTAVAETQIVLRSDYQDIRTSQFQVNTHGQIFAKSTSILALSSERRLKENIALIDPTVSWDTIKNTPYYAYNFIGTPREDVKFGPMADEVPAEMKLATDQSDDVGVIHTYDNAMLQARLYTALQTALTRIEALEAEVNALKGN